MRRLKEAVYMLGYSDMFELTKYRNEYDIGTNNQKGLMKKITILAESKNRI